MVFSQAMTTFHALRKQNVPASLDAAGSRGCAHPASLYWYASFTWALSAGDGHV